MPKENMFQSAVKNYSYSMLAKTINFISLEL